MSQLCSESLQQLDPEVFLRHSEIPDTLHLRLDFLRDFRNCLSLLSKEKHAEFVNELEKDTSFMDLAKFATRELHQESMMSQTDKSKTEKIHDLLSEKITAQRSANYRELTDRRVPHLKVEKTLDYFAFQIYIEIEILQNGEVLGHKLLTGVKFSYELEETLEIPLKVCELAPLTSLAISIYNMDQIEEGPIAATVINLFDQKHRLRQGTWNCQLHLNREPDLTDRCETPALTADKTCAGINTMLRRIRQWRKNSSAKLGFLDQQSFKALNEKMFSMYMN